MFEFFFNNERAYTLDVANFILDVANCNKISVDNMKLQKVMYYLQGEWLAHYSVPLFPSDIVAWKFGPAIPKVHYTFSGFGIDDLVKHRKKWHLNNLYLAEIDYMEKIAFRYLKYDKKILIRMSISESPWLKATHNGTIIDGETVIDIESMKKHFCVAKT